MLRQVLHLKTYSIVVRILLLAASEEQHWRVASALPPSAPQRLRINDETVFDTAGVPAQVGCLNRKNLVFG